MNSYFIQPLWLYKECMERCMVNGLVWFPGNVPIIVDTSDLVRMQCELHNELERVCRV